MNHREQDFSKMNGVWDLVEQALVLVLKHPTVYTLQELIIAEMYTYMHIEHP